MNRELSIQKLVCLAKSYSSDSNIDRYISDDGPSIDQMLSQEIQSDLQHISSRIPEVWKCFRMSDFNIRLTLQDTEDLCSMIHSILKGLSGSLTAFLRTLTVIRCMEYGQGYLFRQLLPNVSLSADTAENIGGIVRRLRSTLSISQDTPIHERKIVERYYQSLANGDFDGIEDFLATVERSNALPEHILSAYLSVVFAKTKLGDFCSWLSDLALNDALMVRSALKSLDFNMLGMVVYNASAPTVKLDALKLMVGKEEGFSHAVLVRCLQQLSKNIVTWSSFSRFFGKYPARYPRLWKSVGEALGSAPSEAINLTVKHFNSGRYNPDKFFGDITQSLMQTGNAQARQDFLSQSLASWRQYYRQRRRQSQDPSVQIEPSNYYVGALNALVSILPLFTVKNYIRRVVCIAYEKRHEWHRSSTSIISEFSLIASQLSAFFEAYEHIRRQNPDSKFEAEISSKINVIYGFYLAGLWSEGPHFVIFADNALGRC